MLTVDSVYQGPGGPDEDRRDEFDRGGWTASHAGEKEELDDAVSDLVQ